MWIVLLALRRPYTFIVAALVLLLTSPVVLLRTPTDIFPNIDIPVVSIIYQYNGLNAQDMERRIILQIERALTTTVNDIEHIESTSLNGVGVIKVFLQPTASIDAGTAQITAIAQTALRSMPTGTQPPLIIRYNASNVPIMQFGLSSAQLSEQEIYDLAQNTMRIALITVNGVAVPFPYGGKTRQVSVDLDLPALQARGLTPTDVVNAISAQNLVLPAGSAKIGNTTYDIEVNTSPLLIQALNDLPVKTVNGAIVFLRDVAFARDGYQPQQNIVRMDGQRGSLVTVFKSGNASTLDVVKGVKAAMPKILAQLPPAPTLAVKLLVDQSLFVQAAIQGVIHEGVIAACLTALMILLFLGSWRSTLIIVVSIPLSILASIAALSALGQTINLMTLGGLALAVGILVDDATVTIENIERHLSQGGKLTDAIVIGAGEIATPALVSTFCICIVFVPMFFLAGVAKFLFVPLAEAVVFAMIASYVLSRTLVPTLAMYLLKAHSADAHADAEKKPSRNILVRFQSGFEKSFERFRYRYAIFLAALLQNRGKVIVGSLFFFAGSWSLLPFLGQDFFPTVDSGQIALHMRARSGLRIEETAKLADQIEQAIRKIIPPNELAGILDNLGVPVSSINTSYNSSGVVGSGDGDILIKLNEKHRPSADYIRTLRRELNQQFPGTTFYFLPADIVSQTINFGLPAPFDIQIYGRDPKNREIAARLLEKIRAVPGAVDLRLQQPNDQPKLRFNVDRTKASEVGLTERDVASNVLLTLSGSGVVTPSYYLNPTNGVSYLISASAPEREISSLQALLKTPISTQASQAGNTVAPTSGQVLANVGTLERGTGPVVLSHYNVQPVLDIYGSVSGRDLGGVYEDILPLVEDAKKELPRGSTILIRGQVQTMHDSYVGLGWGLLAAIVLVYLLLVVNFQSWTDPFIIITALPGALSGVLWMLFVSGTPLSVPALMGAIMCLGVATANSVLVITFARQALLGGKDAINAALDAGASRVRPVLMTALAMMIGMVPMALGLGEGGEQNAPLGRAVIGGLLIATISTLLFVPVVFALIHRHHRREDLELAHVEDPTAPASPAA